MIVIEDYLNQNQFLAMRLAMDTASFPWEKSMVLKDPPAHIKPDDNQQSIHGFYLKNSRREYTSKNFGILKPLLDKLSPLDLIKVKVNQTTQKDRHIEYGLHVNT